MLDLNVLDLEQITHALSDQAAYERCWLIHSQTGEIVYWSADTGIDGHTKIGLDDLDPELITRRTTPSRTCPELGTDNAVPPGTATLSNAISDSTVASDATISVRVTLRKDTALGHVPPELGNHAQNRRVFTGTWRESQVC